MTDDQRRLLNHLNAFGTGRIGAIERDAINSALDEIDRLRQELDEERAIVRRTFTNLADALDTISRFKTQPTKKPRGQQVPEA